MWKLLVGPSTGSGTGGGIPDSQGSSVCPSTSSGTGGGASGTGGGCSGTGGGALGPEGFRMHLFRSLSLSKC
ncbi:hypothetical protein EAO79_08070 [Plantibacter sp. PA-3-X8]|nr:hypothetical protein EAO79_08070 [Plantibacter sp. PA-3-X8]